QDAHVAAVLHARAEGGAAAHAQTAGEAVKRAICNPTKHPDETSSRDGETGPDEQSDKASEQQVGGRTASYTPFRTVVAVCCLLCACLRLGCASSLHVQSPGPGAWPVGGRARSGAWRGRRVSVSLTVPLHGSLRHGVECLCRVCVSA